MRMGTAHPDKSFEMLWASSAPILKLAQVARKGWSLLRAGPY